MESERLVVRGVYFYYYLIFRLLKRFLWSFFKKNEF